ncbi:alpha/beta hydrolase, partial [Escherichia coli]|nr:alpha/beta hydrolase [Salmonella enterica subsp. enterica serovar Schwarzengrund]EFN5661604.1 alpha/beta hydrolase [Escherichia coli]EBN3498458.1 alpha/beta hydrolase [Salmonella enterica subsp. enterica serovar Schwarzengrund]ECG0120006.1 alpha/beta hydrolase [Salmonella enterica subsp. enterica serovar Schwarzengrund]ECI8256331.1 alpha/beta hydrolase [Salmonella enterica subsp. enterica serovar Schwarzengrund]
PGFPPVIFIHGFFMDSRMFKKQIHYLQDKYRIICMDIRGFGRSHCAKSKFTLYDIADDIIKLADHLKLTKFVICGMSMGGYIALRACLRYRERVCGLILIGSQAERDNEETVQNYYFLSKSWGDINIRNNIIEQLLPIIIGKNERDQDSWRVTWGSYDNEIIKNAMHAMLTRDEIIQQIKHITIPVLVIHGEQDLGIPVEAAIKLRANLKYARLAIIPQGAHAVNITHANITNHIIKTWLQDYFC